MFNNISNPLVNHDRMKIWDIDEDIFMEAMNTGQLHKPDCMKKLEQLTKERRNNADQT